MRNLKFQYAKAKNFLCFGNDPVEINFEDYGNIVCVKATNLDVQNESERTNSNGVGKSSISELIPYALFGKTIKKPSKMKHEQVINNKAENDMEVELHYDDCKIIRSLKVGKKPKAILKYWKKIDEKWVDYSQGTMDSTQDLIEKDLGLTYDTFVNIYVFTDDNTRSFLECDAATKREIVENLLSLEKYRIFSDNAKELIKTCKNKTKELSSTYEHHISVLDTNKKRLVSVEKQEKDWKDNKINELNRIKRNLQSKYDELNSTDKGSALANYNSAQEQIEVLKNSISTAEDNKVKLEGILTEAEVKYTSLNDKYCLIKNKIENLSSIIKDCQSKIKSNQKIIDDINNKLGKDCPYCLNAIDESKFASMLAKAKEIVENQNDILNKNNLELEPLNVEFSNLVVSKTKIEKGINDCKIKVNTLTKNITQYHSDISKLSQIKEPETGLEEQRISGQIEELKKQADAKQAELDDISPYEVIKANCLKEIEDKQKEVDDKKQELIEAEKELPYYDFWVKAFGDNGIRKYIVDGIIPALNSRVEYWLQYLIDNKIKLEFDNQLNVTIDRYPFLGRSYVYEGCSGGQRRRLNLTVSQAFAYIRMLNCGASPSVVFLDEVSMNMDEAGIEGIYKMIVELAKEKQVFVIDHSPILLEMLQGCETIQLEMKNAVTTMVK